MTGFCFKALLLCVSSRREVTGETGEIHQQLKQLTEQTVLQNKQLLLQTKQLNQIVKGLKQLCEAFMEEDMDGNDIKGEDIKEEESITNGILPIKVQKSVFSNNLHLTVYVKTLHSPTGLCYLGRDRSFLEYNLTTEAMTSLGTTVEQYRLSSEIPLPVENRNKTHGLFGSDVYIGCSIHGGSHGLQLSFDSSMTSREEEYTFTRPSYDVIENIPERIHLSSVTNKNFTLHVQNGTKIMGFSIKYTWVDENETVKHSRPLFELTRVGGDISVAYPNSSFLSSGGIMELSYSFDERFPYLLTYLRYWKESYILAADRSGPFPEGMVYFDNMQRWLDEPTDNETIYVRSNTTIRCLAYGNPVLSVNMFKLNPKQSVSTISYEYEYRQYITTSVGVGDNWEGQYMCEATSTFGKAEKFFTLKRMVPVEINDENSRLLHNDTDRVVISCEATGIPVPTLEYVSNRRWSGEKLNNVSVTVDPTRHLVRSILTIEPRDPNIWRVLCTAWSETGYFSSRRSKSYQIGQQPEDTYALDYDYAYDYGV